MKIKSQICLDIEINCIYDIFSVSLCVITLISNFVSIYYMCRFNRRVKFENIVILFGIIDLMILLLKIISKYENIFILIVFTQSIIYLFILRRFMRIYSHLRIKYQTKFYNKFFTIGFIINVLFLLYFGLNLVVSIFDNYSFEYVLFSYIIFSLIISFIVLLIGSIVNHSIKCVQREDVKVHLRSYLIDNYNQRDSLTMHLADEGSSNFTELYFIIRKKQLNSIIYVAFFSSIYQIFYYIYKNKTRDINFYITDGIIIPLNTLSSTIYFFYSFSFLLPIICNYYSFYYIVRNSYKEKNELNTTSNVFSTQSFIKRANIEHSKDIENFID